MIIYSVTVSVDDKVKADWLEWMLAKHVEDVMDTGYFENYDFHELLDPKPHPGSTTYNIQYHCLSKFHYEEYLKKAAPALQVDHEAKFKGKYVAFRTLLKRF